MLPNLEDKEFIASLVNKHISSYEVKNGCQEGDNVAGNLKAITAITTETGEQLNLILKRIPDDPPEWIILMKIFQIEHTMYRTIVPMIRDFARSRGLTDYEPPLPRYFSGFNNDKNDYLCLEDVRPLGFVMPDKSKSLSLAEVNLILTELAKFHAVSYALIQYEGEKLFDREDMKYIQSKIFEESIEPNEDAFDKLIQFYYENTTKLMDERNPELAKHMKPLLQNAAKVRSSTDRNSEYFQTLIHYDLWTNNIMIKYDKKTGEPLAVKFIDFQFIRKGNVFSDLQYFIFTSSTPEFRRENLITVLSVYHDEFRRTLDGLKCTHPHGFTKGYFIDEFYKQCFLPGFVHMTFAIPLQLGDLSQGENVDGHDSIYAVRDQYMRSPVALERIDSIVRELIGMKLL